MHTNAHMHIYICVCVHKYIYIHIYIFLNSLQAKSTFNYRVHCSEMDLPSALTKQLFKHIIIAAVSSNIIIIIIISLVLVLALGMRQDHIVLNSIQI